MIMIFEYGIYLTLFLSNASHHVIIKYFCVYLHFRVFDTLQNDAVIFLYKNVYRYLFVIWALSCQRKRDSRLFRLPCQEQYFSMCNKYHFIWQKIYIYIWYERCTIFSVYFGKEKYKQLNIKKLEINFMNIHSFQSIL